MVDFTGTEGDDEFLGTPNHDWARGLGGRDRLFGLYGIDRLEGGAGADYIDGGDYDDFIASYLLVLDPYLTAGRSLDVYADQDTLYGGAGRDQISAGYGDIIDGGADNDTLALNLLGASSGLTVDFRDLTAPGGTIMIGGGTIAGIEQLVEITGTRFADTLTAANVRGNVYGHDGDDILSVSISAASGGTVGQAYGGEGDDEITALAGNRGVINGDNGNDIIRSNWATRGGAGNDLIYAGDEGRTNGLSSHDGDAGDDEIIATGLSLRASGGAGADILRGGANANDLASGEFINGYTATDDGAEHDQLFGGSGDDRFWAGYGDDVDGGAGVDSLWLLSLRGGQAGVTLDLDAVTSGGAVQVGGGTLQNIERVVEVIGTSYNDTITAGTQAIRLRLDGGGGDDTLTGTGSGVDFILGDGNDVAHGSSADDTFEARTGTKIVFGNGGADIFRMVNVNVGAPGTYDGGSGIDTLEYYDLAGGYFEASATTPGLVTVGGNRFTSIEQFVGFGGSDTFDFRAATTGINARGGGGDNVFYGGIGADTFYGGNGSDTATVGVGDFVDTGYGYDTIIVDIASGASSSSMSLIGGSDDYNEIDTLRFAGSASVNLRTNHASVGNVAIALQSIENVYVGVSGGVASEVIGADSQGQRILAVDSRYDDGSAGVRFFGGTGNETMIGSRGDDEFTGGRGTNDINGSDGVDTAIYAGTRAQFTVREYQGVIQVYNGDTILDNLTNVEWIQFSDQRVQIGTTFDPSPDLAYRSFGYSVAAGGWASSGVYPRTAGDVNGDGMDDLVGFGSNGVYVALSKGAGQFGPLMLSSSQFGQSDEAGGFTIDDRYPRMLADVNGDGLDDIVGFGGAGVWVALATGGGNFAAATLALDSFGTSAGGWTSQTVYPRAMADVNGDGMDDIVGFGSSGVLISLATGGGHFGSVVLASAEFGEAPTAGGWGNNDRNPRTVADVDGDGRADIVGFGHDGVHVSLANANGSFDASILAVRSFGDQASAGGWSSDNALPREVADVNGDGMADIVGFGTQGVYVSYATGSGHFADPVLELRSFGSDDQAGGWISNDRFPRILADVNGDGHADLLGYGDAGVYLSLHMI